nr:5-carboxymethyl-2-hydroxymuconate Delta-isomerase [uncultured Cohaesibacter sp.]
MPHLVISYAKGLEQTVEMQKLVQTVWNTAEASGLFTPAAIKARALPVDYFVTGGTDKPFIHVEAKMFGGRTQEQKKALTQSLFETITAFVGADVSVSAETLEIDKATYSKG